MLFSILVVSLNPGDKLLQTLQSIEKQTCRDYEVVIKDGGSTDGSMETAKQYKSILGERLRIVQKEDKGIYDAMNQAVLKAAGEYVYFLNCGDRFYSEQVLAHMEKLIRERQGEEKVPSIYYGNIYERVTGQEVCSNPRLDGFGCYRNVPCHQACFYERQLLLQHPFETVYQVRADYEQFLWCYYRAGAKLVYEKLLIADYEGGGFSETRENRKRSQREHKEITEKYMTGKELFRYRLILAVTLSSLRTRLSRNKWTAGIYNKGKEFLYKKVRG